MQSCFLKLKTYYYLFAWNTTIFLEINLKIKISTSVWSLEHPDAGRNIQQCLFNHCIILRQQSFKKAGKMVILPVLPDPIFFEEQIIS